jgi:hypothetical protein
MTMQRIDPAAFHARAARPAPQSPRSSFLLAMVLLVALAGYATRVDARADTAVPESGCQGAAARVPHASARSSFLGRSCRDAECGAHKAGFAWADRNGVTDPHACAEAEDPGFAEGCEVFATSRVTAEQAGFAWARDNALDDRCRCGGAGPRFEAGCEAFVMISR